MGNIFTGFNKIIRKVDAQMCTSIVLKSDDQLVLHGRTMDFPFELDPDMVFIPRNHSLSLIYEKPLTAHYAFMGLFCYEKILQTFITQFF